MGSEEPPQYTRYRARRRLLGGAIRDANGAARERARQGAARPAPPGRAACAERSRRREIRSGGAGGGAPASTGAACAAAAGGAGRRRNGSCSACSALILGWILLSLLLFLISSHFKRTPLEANVAGALDPAGNPLTSANNILVLGSDRRQKNSKEPGAEKTGPGRSDTIMLIRTGGGHSARLSIPRDTVVRAAARSGPPEDQRGACLRRGEGVGRK